MKKIFILLLVLMSVLQSCKQKDVCSDVVCPNGQVCVDGTCVGQTTNVLVTSNITTNTTWTSENVYELAGRITVVDGVTLTIEPGTIIKVKLVLGQTQRHYWLQGVEKSTQKEHQNYQLYSHQLRMKSHQNN